jgi:hypothetical protein
LQVDPPASGLGGELFLLDDSVVSQSLSDYSVECDAELDNYNGTGDFGLAFRGTLSGGGADYDSLLWNGNGNGQRHWQFVSFSGLSAYKWLDSSAATPIYAPGTWVHLKAVCQGSTFLCYVDLHDGRGEQLVYRDSDATYGLGACGFFCDFLRAPELVRFKNFQVSE